jgi:hypothetical protein
MSDFVLSPFAPNPAKPTRRRFTQGYKPSVPEIPAGPATRRAWLDTLPREIQLHVPEAACYPYCDGAWRDNVFVVHLWRAVKYERNYLRTYDSDAVARADVVIAISSFAK